MGPTDDVDRAAKASPLYAKYGTRVDTRARASCSRRAWPRPRRRLSRPARRPAGRGPQAERASQGGSRSSRRGLAAVGKFLTSRQGQSIEKQVLRGVFGMLKKR